MDRKWAERVAMIFVRHDNGWQHSKCLSLWLQMVVNCSCNIFIVHQVGLLFYSLVQLCNESCYKYYIIILYKSFYHPCGLCYQLQYWSCYVQLYVQLHKLVEKDLVRIKIAGNLGGDGLRDWRDASRRLVFNAELLSNLDQKELWSQL